MRAFLKNSLSAATAVALLVRLLTWFLPLEAPEGVYEGMLTLNIGTYNVMHCEADSARLIAIAEEIRALNLDIVGLQELDDGAKRSGKVNQLARLSLLTGMRFYGFAPALDLKPGRYGVGVLSRYPIASFEYEPLPSGGEEPRTVLRAVIDTGAGKLSFFNTHLSFESSALRAEQQAALAAKLVGGGEPWVLTGDFNISSFDEYAVFDGASLASSAETPLDSFKGVSPFRCIDNIIASRGAIIENAALSLTDSSDHNMIYASVSLPM